MPRRKEIQNIMQLNRIFLLILFLVLSSNCFSQTKHFQHLTNNDGISQSEIYAFLEDSRGFMWIGTLDGLNMYDGYNIKVFNTDKFNSNSIPNNTIRCLTEDQLGRIWIGTENGLCFYDPFSEKIFQVKIPISKENILLLIRSISIDENILLITTISDQFSAEINTTNLEQIESSFKYIKFPFKNNINIIIKKCRDGEFRFVTKSGLYAITSKTYKENPIQCNPLIKNGLNKSIDFEQDMFGNFWIITNSNIFYRYNPSKNKTEQFTFNSINENFFNDKYPSIVIDKNDNLWISTRDQGLLFLDARKLNEVNPQFEHIQFSPLDKRSLNSNQTSAIYVSNKNLLWIGTIGSGINIYDPQQKKFDHVKIPLQNQTLQSNSNFTRSVYSDNENNIWIGTYRNGLYLLNRDNNTFQKAGFGDQSLFYFHNIQGGKALLCKSDGVGLLKFSNQKVQVLSSIIKSVAHFHACNSKDDIVWTSSISGITKFKIVDDNLLKEKEYNINTNPKISINNCRVLFYNKENNELLVGTEGGGLNILKLDQQHNATAIDVYKKNESQNSISNNYIRSITNDSKGNIWIGTYEGLNKLERDNNSGKISFKSFAKKDGLPNNMIQLLIEDNLNQLWIGTNGGLSKFTPKNEQFTNYTETDGLQSNEFSEHTVFKKQNGEIIVGGINGINIFNPKDIVPDTTSPKTTLTGFYLFNKKVEISDKKKNITPLSKSIVLTDTIKLKPHQTSFGFDFSAMLHSNSVKVKYAYLLEGFDKDWNYTDAQNRRANYTNLKYGKYIFKVKSTNIDGKWEDTPRSVYIHIKTPFYYSIVAFIIYILLIILIIAYFTNYTAIKYTTKKKLLLENEHNKKMHELDELRTRFYINISHDLRTPLTLICSPLEMVIKSKDLVPEIKNHLNLVLQNSKKLRYITEQLLDISKAEAGKLSTDIQHQDIVSFIKKEASLFSYAIKNKGLELVFTNSEPTIYTGFDADMISKVFFNLLSNAIKHTNQGEINIYIEKISQPFTKNLKNVKFDSYIRIDIQDSGEGIEQYELDRIFDRYYQGEGKKEKGYGIGLSHCKDLIEILDGHIEASSNIGIGTIFSIYIPDIKTEESQLENWNEKSENEGAEIDDINDTSDEEFLNDNSALQKILIIEDNPDMRNFIKNELRKEYKVFEANDGEQGIEMAVKFSPDLIISDIMLPKFDGIEICMKLKSDIKTSHIPIILLTAKTDDQTKHTGIKMGADDYISKPFEMEYLIIRIKNLLHSREQLRKMFKLENSLNPSVVTISSLDDMFMEQLIDAIEKGIPDPDFSVNSLEAIMGMSHSNFYRKIKYLTGESSKDILLSMRMKRAKQILTDNQNIRISEVAYMVGFTNPKYFSKSFKDYYGMLPSELNKSES